jgi:NADP-dependent 3-hydroxy acid dehydrogenase YdfG
VTGALDGRVALVTGASRGIGLAIARTLAASGAQVAMLARSASVLAERAAEIGDRAMAIPCDVSDAGAVERAMAAVRIALGDPAILVNNAGVFQPRPIEAITPGDFARTVQVNLVAPFVVAHALLPAMRARMAGHIVTIGSVADRSALPGNGAYAATKYGVRAMHEVMRNELRGTGVRTTLVSPGPTDTEIWDDVERESGVHRHFPTRSEMMPPEAVASAVLYAVTQPAVVNVDELRLSRS